MSSALALSYSRAMAAALQGSGYPGAQFEFSNGVSRPAANRSSAKRLFDFTADRLPNHSSSPATFVEVVLHGLRNQDWSGVFVYLLLILIPSGLVVFVARDRFYRRRGAVTIDLGLRAR